MALFGLAAQTKILPFIFDAMTAKVKSFNFENENMFLILYWNVSYNRAKALNLFKNGSRTVRCIFWNAGS